MKWDYAMSCQPYIKTFVKFYLRFILGLFLCSAVSANASQTDPLNSPMWHYLMPKFLGDQPYVFDKDVRVIVPEFAEDSSQVPLTVDASKYIGEIKEIVVWADLNPIQHIFTYFPHPDLKPVISLRFRVQQATPVRAAVKTRDDVWHVGYAEIDAQGGGCTAPSISATVPYWETHLGEVESRGFKRNEGQRYRFQVIHPMDTGLADAIPEFYIESLIIKNAQGQTTAQMSLSQPVSENPMFTFDFVDSSSNYSLWMRDNGGNIFESAL